MSMAVIRAERLGKRYRLGQRERYLALRDVLTRALAFPLRVLRGDGARASREYIWALRDVNFEVREGDVVGIIGRNGSGKSTLLKILSRITRPTEGRAEVTGRVGSLLEVGTGFHPELTGRENVYLSGAILGMRRQEIEGKFDEIVAFAELEKFIDTTVKYYSSGMYMRLAFAVAAHLEPDILLVDEVLAVGDLAFQKKCLTRMGDVARAGRTVLFVSHQMNQIRRICRNCIWLDDGRIRMEGLTPNVVAAYETAVTMGTVGEQHRQCFLRWAASDGSNVLTDSKEGLSIHFFVRLAAPITRGHFGVLVLNEAGVNLIGWGFDELDIPAGDQELILRIPSLPLRPGAYSLYCTLWDRGNNLTGGTLLDEWNAIPPLVVDTPPVAHPQDEWAGLMNIPARLEIGGN